MDFMNTILGLLNSEFIMSCVGMAILLGIIIHLNNIINEKNDIINDYENQLRENAEYIKDIQSENIELRLKNTYSNDNTVDNDAVEKALSDLKSLSDAKIAQYEDTIARQNITIQDLQRRLTNEERNRSMHINQVAKSGDGSYMFQIGELNVVNKNKREYRAPSSGSAIFDMMASTHRLIDEANDKKSAHQKYQEMVNEILDDNK